MPVFTPITFETNPLGMAITMRGEYVTEGAAIYGTDMRVFDPNGKEFTGSPSAKLPGFDVVVDEACNVLWVSGAVLARGDPVALTGNTVATYGWVAPSLDVVPGDGSVWVAERSYSVGGAIHHYDASGAEIAGDLHSWSASPFCVRINPHSGDVWVADSGGISGIDSTGTVTLIEAYGHDL